MPRREPVSNGYYRALYQRIDRLWQLSNHQAQRELYLVSSSGLRVTKSIPDGSLKKNWEKVYFRSQILECVCEAILDIWQYCHVLDLIDILDLSNAGAIHSCYIIVQYWKIPVSGTYKYAFSKNWFPNWVEVLVLWTRETIQQQKNLLPKLHLVLHISFSWFTFGYSSRVLNYHINVVSSSS